MKKVKFRRIFGDKFAEKTADFAGIFGATFGEKQKRKPKRKILEKIYIYGRMSNSGQERKHKSSSNTVLKAIVLVSSYKKNISFTETSGRLTRFLRAEHSNAINFFSLLGLLCCFAVYKARLFMIEGSNPFVKSKHCCVFDRVLHVPLNMCLHYYRQQFFSHSV